MNGAGGSSEGRGCARHTSLQRRRLRGPAAAVLVLGRRGPRPPGGTGPNTRRGVEGKERSARPRSFCGVEAQEWRGWRCAGSGAREASVPSHGPEQTITPTTRPHDVETKSEGNEALEIYNSVGRDLENSGQRRPGRAPASPRLLLVSERSLRRPSPATSTPCGTA